MMTLLRFILNKDKNTQQVSIIRIKFLAIIFILSLILFLIFNIFVKDFKYRRGFKKGKEKSKIILIGIDGADWSVIYKLIEQNKLPNFAKLIKNGAYGDILSPKLISNVSFTSLITGKPPEENGITDLFIKYPGEYKLSPITSNHRKAKALWDIFSENNKSVGIMGWCTTYPAEKVKGFIVSNYIFFLPSMNQLRLFNSIEKKYITYPEHIVNDVMHTGQMSELDIRSQLAQNFLMLVSFFSNKNLLKDIFIKGIQTEMALTKVGKYLLQKYCPDLFAIYFGPLDIAEHVFWNYVDCEGPWEIEINKEDIEKYGQVIFDYYRAYDEMLGELLNDIENTTVIIVSTNGMGPTYSPITVNNNLNFIFEKMGWLTYRSDESEEPDWTKTKVYDYGIYTSWRKTQKHIYINLKGRDPQGVVPENEYESFRQEIKNLLEEAKTIEGEPLIEHVEIPKRVKFYEQGIQPPDLIVKFRHRITYNFKVRIKDKIYIMDKKLNRPLFVAGHSDYGVIIMSGKNIKKGVIKGANYLDIAPTILALAGLPIGKDMKGKVLTDAIKEKFLQNNPISYIASYEGAKEKRAAESTSALMDEHREKLKERLKTMGYIQ